ncbi:hypothetical protein M9979_13890 [Sphingomonas sp. RP10(2022)]|uniref:Uncharacterized protein n=1 Tax=Sphingomonas liriopis TaxID=2949094 RepID=A0A9X2I169_9SPHN|nr:hypothetical protein [Sphingomonas liriopis]MCP3735960.1 hypothetical protein [Sphingomonas liriopis]
MTATSTQVRLRDHRFFFWLAVAMTVVIVAGFSMQLAMGRSSFAVPVRLHIHAAVFFGWTALYLMQNWLVASGSVALHRRIGWLGAGWAVAVVVLGIYMTVMMVRRGGAPFFFVPSYFLFMNSLSVLCFGGLVAAAIRLRRQTAWHNRLMACAMAGLTGPAWGRLLPAPFMIPWVGWGVFAAVMLFPIAGVVADLRTRGRVHPGWWWGIAALTVTQVAMDVAATSAPGLALYRAAVAGTPGEAVAPLSYPPFPPLS